MSRTVQPFGLFYLDLTEASPQEKFLPIYVIRQLIAVQTDRSLSFETFANQKDYPNLLKLVRFPNPVGFAIVAAQNIPANTILCPYGGETLSAKKKQVIDDSNDNKESEYLFTANNQNGRPIVMQQAKEYGDLGALFAHLPSTETLAECDFDTTTRENIQTANTRVVHIYMQNIKKYRLHLVTTCTVRAGSILGCDYGRDYWYSARTSPCFFKRGTPEILAAKINNPRVYFSNPETNSSTFYDPETGKNSTRISMTFVDIFGLIIATTPNRKIGNDLQVSAKGCSVFINELAFFALAEQHEAAATKPTGQNMLLFMPVKYEPNRSASASAAASARAH